VAYDCDNVCVGARPYDGVNAAMELAVAHGEYLLARVAVGVEDAVDVGDRKLLAVRLHLWAGEMRRR
jgi:hypothetical protein